jgi:hypothetical protein
MACATNGQVRGRCHPAPRRNGTQGPVRARSDTKVFSGPNPGQLTRILSLALGASLRDGAMAILEGAVGSGLDRVARRTIASVPRGGVSRTREVAANTPTGLRDLR